MSWDEPGRRQRGRADPRPPVTHDGRPVAPAPRPRPAPGPRAPASPSRGPPGPPPRPAPKWRPVPPPPPTASRARGWIIATWVIIGTGVLLIPFGLGLTLLLLPLAMVTGLVGGVLGLRERRRGVPGAGGQSAWGFVGAGLGVIGLVGLLLLILLIIALGMVMECLFSFGLAC